MVVVVIMIVIVVVVMVVVMVVVVVVIMVVIMIPMHMVVLMYIPRVMPMPLNLLHNVHLRMPMSVNVDRLAVVPARTPTHLAPPLAVYCRVRSRKDDLLPSRLDRFSQRAQLEPDIGDQRRDLFPLFSRPSRQHGSLRERRANKDGGNSRRSFDLHHFCGAFVLSC